MLAYLCSCLAVTHVLAAATTVSSECSGTAEQPVAVEGWPVLVAMRIPILATVTLNLSLSADNDVHTNLTFTHEKQEGKEVGMVEATLHTRMATTPLYTVALLPDSHWATLRLAKEHKELEMRVDSEVRSSRYSTTALLSTTHHLHVDTVYCKGSSCSLVDLKCLHSNISDTGKSNHTTEEPSPSSGTHKVAYYWAFYAIISLLVIACLLFFVWRNEQNKFRARWLRHSQGVRHATSSSTGQEGNTCHAGGTSEAVEWRAGKSGGRCSFVYNGPCTGDSD